jgi:Spy/CpxP family protein refolding chaperone
MKTWIRRTLIGLTATTVLLGGLAACSHGPRFGHGPMTDADVAQLRERFIAKAGSKLDLDAAQKARLATLADALQAQRSALVAGGEPRAELQALVAGTRFDRARAQALVEGKTAAVRDKAPAVVTAMADFFDSLNPAQQQKLRDMLARGRHRG